MTQPDQHRANQATPDLVEHFFRHEYGRLVALLMHRWGSHRLELIEDVVQAALAKALSNWSRQGLPPNPSGWLYQTAHRLAIDHQRREQAAQRLAPDWAERQVLPLAADAQQERDAAVDSAIGDETLRLLFLCCHESIPAESRVALALKTVGGFSVKEIASGLLTTTDNIEKRLGRARERLRQDRQSLTELTTAGVAQRLETVLSTVYLIFNEGYSASQGQTSLRRDLCDEALRQSHMLATHPICGQPASYALHALLLLHSARLDSRLTADGQVVLLADQNRESWNWDAVRSALDWLRRSATGPQLSRYHIEAAIAWEHCRAPEFAATDWKRIAECYERLVLEWSTPMIRLNQAIAVSYAHAAEEGIRLLLAIDAAQRRPIRPWWDCALAQMYQRSGAIELALAHWRDALALALGPAQRDVIAKHLRELEEQTRQPGT